MCMPVRFSFRGHEQRDQRSAAFQVGEAPLLFQLATAENENAVEISGEACSVQYPNQPSAGDFLSQPFAYLGLRRSVESRGCLVEDQKVGALEHRAGDRGLLALRQGEARPA